MKSILYILLFWLAGQAVSLLIGGFLPGNVLGMVMLFAALKSGKLNAEKIRPAAEFLLQNMAMFFVPFGVGLMVSYGLIMNNFAAIVISSLVSTVVLIVFAGKMFEYLTRRKEGAK